MVGRSLSAVPVSGALLGMSGAGSGVAQRDHRAAVGSRRGSFWGRGVAVFGAVLGAVFGVFLGCFFGVFFWGVFWFWAVFGL